MGKMNCLFMKLTAFKPVHSNNPSVSFILENTSVLHYDISTPGNALDRLALRWAVANEHRQGIAAQGLAVGQLHLLSHRGQL